MRKMERQAIGEFVDVELVDLKGAYERDLFPQYF
jgi:hypothetical protein